MVEIALSCSTSCIPAYNRSEAMDAIARAGFRYIDACSFETESRLHPDVVLSDQVTSDLRKFGLELSGLNVSDIQVGCNLTGIKMEIEYAVSLGIRSVNIKGGSRTERDMNALVNSLKILTKFADKLGVRINLRNFHGNRVDTLEDIETVLERVDHPNLGVALDIGQLHSSKINPLEAIDRLFDKISVVYLRDQVGNRVVPFGKGEIDNKAIVSKLLSKGFQGCIVADPEVKLKDVEPHIVGAHEFLEGILAATGKQQG